MSQCVDGWMSEGTRAFTNEHVNALTQLREVIQAVCIDAKYEGYLAKQARLVEGMQNLNKRKLPIDIDYRQIEHLRGEAKEKLSVFRPGTLGQVSRIGGITPADVTVLQIHLRKYH